MKRWIAIAVALAVTLFSIVPSATAIAPFRKAFVDKYAQELQNPVFADAVKKAGCNVCHQPNEDNDKGLRNAYGEELAKLVPGNANQRINAARENGTAAQRDETEKVLAEFAEALGKVEALPAPAGGTFLQRIQGGNLPVDLPPAN